MNFTHLSASQSVSLVRRPVARLGQGLLITTLAAAVIACAPARKAAYPVSPLFESVVADNSPSVVIKKDIDLVRLEGVLASQEQIDLVTQGTADLFGAEMIINSLVVDDTLADADWLDSVLQTVGTMQDVEDFSLVAGSGHLVVGGTVDTYDQAEQIANTASDLAGLNLAVSSTIDYPEVTAPDIEIVVADDGELVDFEKLVVTENTVSEPPPLVPLVPVEGVEVSLASLAVLEQQALAVAVEQPVAIPVAAVAVAPEQPVMPAPVESPEIFPEVVSEAIPEAISEDVAVEEAVVIPEDFVVIPASVRDQVVDSDGDGVVDVNDECTSRSGYPVNTRGCQLLDGYLKDVHFHGASDQLTEEAMFSLNDIADIMGAHPDSKIAVLSYSQDGSPTEMRTQARERAYSVVDYLVGQGIEPARLQAFALAHRQGISEQILIKEVD